MIKSRSVALLCALPVLIAAAPNWKAQALAAAAPIIDRANAEWETAIVTGDANKLSAPYADGGIFIGPDGSTIVGHDAVRAMYARPRSAQVVKARISSDGRAAADPDDVYEWGSATMTVRRDGKIKSATGRYLTVWHRDGRAWRITRNIAF